MEIGEIIKWLTPVVVTILLAAIGYIVNSHRGLAKGTSDEHRRLHEKIDRLKDEAARKDDVEKHIERLERAMAEFRQDVGHKIDQLLRLLTESIKR